MNLIKLSKNILVSTLVILITSLSITKYSFIGYSWPPNLVRKCIENTSVFFVEYPSGGIIGAGVIISKEGRVLTAAHLFTHGEYSKVQMVTSNGNAYDMNVLLVNSRIDLALVEPVASAQQFSFAPVYSENKLSMGQDVLVVGHPYAGYWTITSGTISRISWSPWYFCKLIETDARVNPGNSGGPMFNTKGEVIGIISAMKMGLFGPTGIGIAIHVNEIHAFLKSYERLEEKSTQTKRYKLGEVR